MLVRPRAFDNFSANQCHCLVFRRWGDVTVGEGGGGDQGGGVGGGGGGGIALLVRIHVCVLFRCIGLSVSRDGYRLVIPPPEGTGSYVCWFVV